VTAIRESKKVETKERLLTVSLDLFIDKGFDHTSIEDITVGAGVAKGTFYNFFEKKEDVLLYYLDRELVKSRHEIEQKIDAMKTIVDKLELLIITYLKYIFRNKGFARVLVRERVCKIGTGKNWNEMVLMQTIKQLLDEARDQGELKKTVDLDNTAEIVFAIFTMYTIYWMNGLIKDKKECAEKVRGVLKMLFDGIGEI
jgi:AcrR family transcriptional regulator